MTNPTPNPTDDAGLRRDIEKLLTKQARLVISSRDLRAPNKYEILPELLHLYQRRLEQVVNEVIGEDDEVEPMSNAWRGDDDEMGDVRNELRAEQRQRFNQLLKGDTHASK